MSRRRAKATLAMVAMTLLAAPTVGDIGSCGQELLELDPVKFFNEKAFIDCRKCQDCGLTTATCERACAGQLEQTEFPLGCFPLVHDGAVCLNALRHASCGDYRPYVDDAAPTIPTECNFCPVEVTPTSGAGGAGGTSGEGGDGAGGGFTG